MAFSVRMFGCPFVPTFQISTFQASYDLDLKSKVDRFNGQILKIFSDLNPIRDRDLAIWTSTFHAQCYVELKSNVVIVNG